jgi:hypothetical protein
MELSHIRSHERSESVLFEKDLGEVYAEARETMLATPVKLASERAENGLRVIHDRILRELAGRGWKIGVGIFPASAPAMFQRGHYRLDATKKAGSGGALGFICHFGSSEFLVRKLMLISEAVRQGIVDCGVLALMTRSVKPYIAGRPAFYEQAERTLRTYGLSGFRGIPMVLWGLTPEVMHPGLTDGGAGLRAGVR